MTTPDQPTVGLSSSALANIESISEGFQRGENISEIQVRIRKASDDGRGIRDVDLRAALQFLGSGVISEGFDKDETEEQSRARFVEATGRQISTRALRQARGFLRGEQSSPIPPPDQRFTLDRTKSPDPARAPLSKGPLLRQFSYRVGIVDKATGEISGHVQVSSSRRLSIGEINSQANTSIGSAGVENYVDDDVPDEFELVVLGSLEASETLT